MSEVMIRVEGLGKQYRIGERREPSRSMRDSLTSALVSPVHRASELFRRHGGGSADSLDQTIWAIKDISFEVRRGEVVGLIGRNGAGKSTLLKILSRITEPTEGRAQLCGRVGSLLEVGSGFHPELTGRENIYLNGAILGLRRTEIERKFGEIVAFSEIGKFIDTPVKHYSSGMYVRLAFAVAAHMDPEILLVDEVLAVGDYRFQEKCLGRMQDVTSQGRTILFVSHNMRAISQICTRAILLSSGCVEIDGDAATSIRKYTGLDQEDVAEATWPVESSPGNHAVRLLGIRVRDTNDRIKSAFRYTEPIQICVDFLVLDDAVDLYLNMYLENEDGVFVLFANTVQNESRFRKGVHEARYTIAAHFLNEGRYFVRQVLFKERAVTSPENIAHVEYPVSFSVDYTGKFTGGQMRKYVGVVRPDWAWQISAVP